jgi:hypothetical protein
MIAAVPEGLFVPSNSPTETESPTEPLPTSAQVLADMVRDAWGVRHRESQMLTVGAVPAAVGLAAGNAYLGWQFAKPGQDLWYPAALVAAVAMGIIIVGAVVLFWLHAPRTTLIFAALTVVLAIPSAWCAMEYSLPDRMAWDTAATRQAALLLQMPPTDVCSEGAIKPKDIGPLSGVDFRCVYTQQSEVYYRNGPQTGIVYHAGGSLPSLPDDCARHLVGAWWAFTGPTCPSGYQGPQPGA